MTESLTIVGAGAIGGTIAAYLARAGLPVQLVDANPSHVAAIQQKGLRIQTSEGEFVVPLKIDTPESYTGTLSQVFLAVKAPQTEAALKWLAPRLTETGWVMSTQNGLNELQIADAIGPDRTVGSFINFFSDVLEPGMIHYGGPGTFAIGELDGDLSDRVIEIGRWVESFIRPIITLNIWGYLWSKLAYGAILFATATTDETMADCVDHPRYRPMLRRLGQEVVGLAEIQDVTLMRFDGWDPNALDDETDCYTMFDRVSHMMRGNAKVRSGVWRDLAVHHRKTEVDAQYGPVLAMAEQRRYPMPMLRTLVELIHALEAGRIDRSLENLEAILNA